MYAGPLLTVSMVPAIVAARRRVARRLRVAAGSGGHGGLEASERAD
jgi:hypothetical protein